MKAKINITEFRKGLASTVKTIDKKHITPSIQSLKFEFQQVNDYSTLIMTATNQSEFVKYYITVDKLEGESEFLLADVNSLLTFINNQKDDDKDIVAEIKESVIFIKIGRKKIQLPISLETENFPKDPAMKGSSILKVESFNDFRDDLNRTKLFSARDELRPVMQCVNVNTNDIVATDGLSLYKKVFNHKCDNEFSLNIPISFINVLPKLKIDKPAEIKFTDKNIFINIGSLDLFCALIPGHYPAYPSVIPDYDSPGLTALSFSFDTLKQSISEALLFGNKATGSVTFLATESKLTILSEDVDFKTKYKDEFNHNGLENFKIDENTPTFKFNLNSSILLKVLNSINNVDELTMKSFGPEKAFVMKNNDEIYLIMPLFIG